MGRLVDRLTWHSVFVFLFGAIVSFADLITDILTLAEFYRADHKTWFGVGLAFIILPCLAYSVLLRVCLPSQSGEGTGNCARGTLQIIYIFGFNPLSSALARLRAGVFCLKNFKKLWRGDKIESSNYTDKLLLHSEGTLFIEAIFESTPQFIIQLYAVSVQQEPVQIIQMISLPVSFLSLAWASTVADVRQREMQREEQEASLDVLNVKHKLLHFVTHLFLLSSRLFAIGFFIVSYKWWVICVLTIHSMATLLVDCIWLCQKATEHYSDYEDDLYKWGILFELIVASVFYNCFSCLHWLRDDMYASRKLDWATEKSAEIRLQLFSNVLFVVENIAMILLFYFSPFSNTWYSLPVTICVCLFSILGAIIRVTHFCFL